MKLSELAIVKTGLVLARKAADLNIGQQHKYRQLNLKCIDEDGTVNMNELDTFWSKEELGENYLTRIGDIVVRLTVPNTAVLITEEFKNLLVTSHFCIIRINSDNTLPEYLQWYLNSGIVKSQIAKNITGVSFAGIKPGFYSDLTVKIPAMAEQQRIADIYKTAQREFKLLEELKMQKTLFYNVVLGDLYKKIKRNGAMTK